MLPVAELHYAYRHCGAPEDLIFTEPYFQAEQNRWTSPWLDATAARFREDFELHVAISRLKLKFMAQPETLIHGILTLHEQIRRGAIMRRPGVGAGIHVEQRDGVPASI